ncbi:MAG: hypothetical protein PHQ66_03580 [Candidatus Nanoarchaeia archaeon]|nr:hypothetical protein [Candidatus Nanoarchaeia archaeon]MDD5357557.1 hypothetical protein [Candidatus Nanoarchaeia archaeon]MDD5588476.1 hypothetical protein [Candidatus Nanoarchaeia archaeon]
MKRTQNHYRIISLLKDVERYNDDYINSLKKINDELQEITKKLPADDPVINELQCYIHDFESSISHKTPQDKLETIARNSLLTKLSVPPLPI